jgi:hypothetical protein
MSKLNKKEYEDYFKSVLQEIEKEFEKSSEYSSKIDEEIAKFKDIVASKNGQHYLVEHIRNAIELQGQRQSLIKDKFLIKKAILDYAMKNEEDASAGKSVFEILSKITELDKKNALNSINIKNNQKDIDEALAKKASEEDEE